MKVLIVGNLGYIGPIVAKHLKSKYKNIELIGFDIGYFSHVVTTKERDPETYLNTQYFGDVRNFPEQILNGIDSVIYLAAISNDPMGNKFEGVTRDVNYLSCIKLAKTASTKKVKSFVFASSCSIYGFAEDGIRSEESELNPLTAYAESKISAENDLQQFASETFTITCLRFATACGFSPRLRLDLVLNDFVATALTTGRIEILSDGTPWRPLIHVKDMARAIEWAVRRDMGNCGPYFAVNVGSNKWNYQVKELAEGVKNVFGNLYVSINESAEPDKRSYKVDFSKFAEIASNYTPKVTLAAAVKDLKTGLESIDFNNNNFRYSNLMRLNVLKDHIKNKRLNHKLMWETKVDEI